MANLLLITGLLVLLFIAGAIAIGYAISAPRYVGAVSDHFDGKTFFTPGAPAPKGLPDVLNWQFNRERTQSWAPHTLHPQGPPPPPRVEGSELRVTFINHSSTLLQFDGLNVLTDPIFDQRVSPFQFIGPRRVHPPGIRFDDLPPIDVLLLSHNHWDHLEIGTVRQLSKRDQPRIICPLGVKAFLDREGCRNVTELDWQQRLQFNERTTVHCVPAQHFSGRGLFDRNATLWAGFVLDNVLAGTLYFAGDSGYGPHFSDIGRQFGPFRLALIPIGAYKPTWFMGPIHCDPAGAVQIHDDVGSLQSVAIHFGTFPLADDGQTEPVDDLQTALAQKGIATDRFVALKAGQSIVLN